MPGDYIEVNDEIANIDELIIIRYLFELILGASNNKYQVLKSKIPAENA